MPRLLNQAVLCWAALAAAAPAPIPQAESTSASDSATASDGPASSIATSPPAPGESGAAPPRVSSGLSGSTTHGPYDGTATTTGAVQAPSTIGTVIPPLGPNPTHTYYNANGELQNPAPVPYEPAGGLGTNGTEPRYMVNSDFDFESLALGLYQEWIELDLFQFGLEKFSEQEFSDAGLTAEDRDLIAFFAEQETGHATLLTNMLGEAAPVQCTYDYPFTTVREFIDFNSKLTQWGEAGVYGFIQHLDSREAATLLGQSIATEARQQYTFRQLLGVPPAPVWFEAGLPQSWAWTYLAPYISSCPEGTTRLAWQNFPALRFTNQPNPNRLHPADTADNEVVGPRVADPSVSDLEEGESCVQVTDQEGLDCGPAIATNRSEPLSYPGRLVRFTWDAPGMPVGPNNSYVTSTAESVGPPKFVAWVNQLNLTYTPLELSSDAGENSGYTYQPAGEVYEGDPLVNQTTFVALTDTDLFVTPFNLSMINSHVVALGLYQAG